MSHNFEILKSDFGGQKCHHPPNTEHEVTPLHKLQVFFCTIVNTGLTEEGYECCRDVDIKLSSKERERTMHHYLLFYLSIDEDNIL